MANESLRNASGMPLGGIGAGKVEFCPNGKFTNCTASNNWDAPITGSGASPEGDTPEGPGIGGAFLARYVQAAGAQLLRTYGHGVMAPILEQDMHFEAAFPLAHVQYAPLGGVELALDAYSPLLLDENPEDEYRNSALPVAIFRFTLTNRNPQARQAAVAMSWENLVGRGGYAGVVVNHTECRACEAFQDEKVVGVRFFPTKEQINARTWGEYALQAMRQPGVTVSTLAGWNLDGDGKDFWESFSREGVLSSDCDRVTGGAIGFQFMRLDGGALAQRVELGPGEERVLTFVLSWFFPHLLAPGLPAVDYGHAYENWFGSAAEAGRYALEHAEDLLESTRRWHEFLRQSSLPGWLVRKLCNDLAVLFSNSWYTKDHRFSMNESPTFMRGCMGTLDQRLASGSILTMCFPALAKEELRLWARQQITESDPHRYGRHWDCQEGRFGRELDRLGAIRHDLGWDHLEGGELGTPGWLLLHWPDLAPAFVIQCYTVASWTGDEGFLAEMYPHIKSALTFVERLDQDGDGVPDLWGPGSCTYDNENFPYYGASAYVASLYLASLRLGKKLAERHQDKDFAAYCDAQAARVRQAIETKLWDESKGYFISWRDDLAPCWAGGPRPHAASSENCMVGQVAGEWVSGMFGLEPGVPREQLMKALRQIFRRNVAPIAGCPANEVSPQGQHSFSWPFYAEIYFASNACYWGLADEGLEAMRRIDHAISEVAEAPWDAPLVWGGPDNTRPGWGRWYMSSPASWFFLPALGGVVYDALEKLIRLDPHIPQAIGQGQELLNLPLFFPQGWLALTVRLHERSREFELKLVRRIRKDGIHLESVLLRAPENVSAEHITVYCGRTVHTGVEFDSGTGLFRVPLAASLLDDGNILRLQLTW